MMTQLNEHVSQLGWRTTLLYIFSRGCAYLKLPITVHAYRLVAQPIAQTPRLPARRAGRFTWKILDSDDPALDEMPLTDKVRAFRFAQGAKCLGLFHDSDLAGYLWLCRETYDEDEVRARFLLEPAARTAWDFDVYVMPAYRAGFAFSALWDAADAYLRKQGVAWSLSRISAFNLASVASHRALGARELGRATFFSSGPLQVSKTNLRPRWHVSLSPDKRPAITLRVLEHMDAF